MLINLSDILSKEGETQRVEAMVDMENFTSRLGTFPVQKKTPVHFTIKNKGKKVLIKGWPVLNTAGFLLGKWIGRSLEIVLWMRRKMYR